MPTPLLDDLRRPWSSGAVKAVPLGGRRRRVRCASGRSPPDAATATSICWAWTSTLPDTHPALATAPDARRRRTDSDGCPRGLPAVRIAGKRRVTRFVEMVGAPPDEPDALADWPIV